jgi:vancomycin aglycone glucosyltransferase
MRVLSSTYGSRGDVEPMVGLAVQLRALATEVPVWAPPDFAELLARVGMPLVPVGQPVRPLVTGATPPSAADLPRRGRVGRRAVRHGPRPRDVTRWWRSAMPAGAWP